ncbi:hypothetical protein L6452_21224 [Arctium lappa]|uniref:Uncharacterized protein n=1 Tax=Arctium lappa TaxID=4217 RepID=A0ACB9BED0_ARCLA|nr:hypothetical protein L6452_21224 [Arctium lappa]
MKQNRNPELHIKSKLGHQKLGIFDLSFSLNLSRCENQWRIQQTHRRKQPQSSKTPHNHRLLIIRIHRIRIYQIRPPHHRLQFPPPPQTPQ